MVRNMTGSSGVWRTAGRVCAETSVAHETKPQLCGVKPCVKSHETSNDKASSETTGRCEKLVRARVVSRTGVEKAEVCAVPGRQRMAQVGGMDRPTNEDRR